MPKRQFKHSSNFYRKRIKLLHEKNSERTGIKTDSSTVFHCEEATVSNSVCEIIPNELLDSEPIPKADESLSSLEPNICEDSDSSVDWLMVEPEVECASNINLQDETQASSKLRDKLKNWVIQSSIPQVHVNSLLNILRTEGINGLPKDCRTLIGTPRNIEIQKLGDGEFWYNGIENILKPIVFADDIECLKLNFHIDGLPTGKSTKSQFWPILMNIANVPELSSECYPVAIYCGNSKPESAYLFLNQFVEELQQLLEKGFVNIQGKTILVKVNAIICDTPARAFVKCVLSHNAYHSCIKCIVTGIYDKNGRHISFPQTNCPKRTDMSFRNKEDPDHHQKNKNTNQIIPSPLEKLIIDMVKDFVVADSLHLLHLGVTKRCLKGWVNGSYNFKEKFFAPQVKIISSWLVESNKMIPKDIHRSVTGLDYLPQWKATEYRTFLLYLGPVILKDHLSEQAYKHFMLLFCATTILSANFYVQKTNFLDVAEQMLIDYIEMFITLYGEDSISSNIHNLCHVVDDVRRFGCLPEISTYKFENELGIIKNHLRSGNKPLVQAAKRLLEKSFIEREYQPKTEIIFKGPMQNPGHYNSIVIRNIFFKTNNKDQWFLSKNNEVIKIISAYGSQENPKILGCAIKKLELFFTFPVDSKKINIFKSSHEYISENTFCVSDIKCKLLRLEHNNEMYFFPLVHTLDVFNKNIK